MSMRVAQLWRQGMPVGMARRAGSITGSVIDSSTSLLQRQTHDIVRLAMGSPAPEMIPSAELAILAAEVLGSRVDDVYDYGPTEGETGLRHAVQALVERAEATATEDDRLLITSGGMQGLDLACKLFVDPGDLVVTESPTYTNGTAVIRGYGGRILEAPVDADGMVVEGLPELVEAAGQNPAVVYVIPNFQNPTGTTLSRERRQRLIEFAERWGSVILEDDPYGLLRFEGENIPGFKRLAEGRVPVVSVRTFSKIVAPGIRVGWVTAEPDVIARMVAAKQGVDTCTNVPMQRLVAAFLKSGGLQRHLNHVRDEYLARKHYMREALEQQLGALGGSWTDPDGGFFTWITLPEAVDAEALFPLALEEGVAYIPGPAFSPSGRFRNSLRLCFASSDRDRTLLGVRRLRAALDRAAEGA